MFDRLAPRYDIFNHLTSLGMATSWRKETLRDVSNGMKVLDLGCGTGDLSLGALQKIGDSGEVTGLDFSPQMLAIAKTRCAKAGFNGRHGLKFIEASAEALPVEPGLYDLIVSGFVLRNLYENIDAILRGVHASLKNGGKISFLDITDPENRTVGVLWKAYMNSVVAFYGKILFGKDYPVFYLTQSAERFLKAKDFVKKLGETGFVEIETQSFMFGTVTLYRARKIS